MTPSTPRLATTRQEARQAVLDARAVGKKVGLVPTMGALHEGHLSLIREAKKQCDVVAATIFVNPTQFGPQEDFDKYPRTFEADQQVLASLGVDLIFHPSKDEMYPPGCATFVESPVAAAPLEGRCRPEHFRGVTTVVLKLFNIVPADVAYFGQKDYQQTVVVRRMVEDLNVPIQIQVCPTVREPDGLAMSSRNAYLSPEERARSLSLYRSLQVAEKMADAGEKDASAILEKMKQTLLEAGVNDIDYVALADPESLEDVERLEGPAVALIAARVGRTRLIDNCLLD